MPYKDYGRLSVYSVDPESLLALKLTSARFDSKDMSDSIVLMKHLGIETREQLFSIIEKYTAPNRHTMACQFFTEEAFERYQKELEIEKETMNPGGDRDLYDPSDDWEDR